MTDINMRELLKAGVHFGHQTRYWSPAMAPYIFGDRNKIHIINLEKTLPMLKEAMSYLGSITAEGGKVLFVGTKRQAGKLVKEHAQSCGSPFVDHRWLGGMLTNYKTVKNSISRLKELEQRIESGATIRLSKKEGLSLERERTKLDKTLSGIKDMNGLPAVLFIIDVENEYIAVAEANKLGIPVVAVVDSNCSPKGIDYIIPGNDDSSRAIKLYLEAAANAILDSRTAARSFDALPDDEYIEVDAEGDVVSARKVTAVIKKTKRVIKVVGDNVEVESTEAANTEAESPPKKTVAKKKVVKKKVTTTKSKDSVASKSTATEENSTAAKTVSEDKVAKKKVVKKKAAAKKSVAKKVTKKKSANAKA